MATTLGRGFRGIPGPRHYTPFCAPDELCNPEISVGYFDHCAPEEAPLPPQPGCSLIDNETECIASECLPLYEGIDCTCDADGCACAEWAFIDCH